MPGAALRMEATRAQHRGNRTAMHHDVTFVAPLTVWAAQLCPAWPLDGACPKPQFTYRACQLGSHLLGKQLTCKGRAASDAVAAPRAWVTCCQG
eukprot:59369-Chlamydomonas_euryale.AAC.5